jgi:hypothetical protein
MKTTVLSALLITAFTIAQQPNTPQASLVINAVAGPPYPITMTVQTNAPATGFFHGAAGVPYLLVRSLTGQLQPGAATFFGDSFDLPLSPMPMIEHNGFDPGPLGAPFHTNGSGNANLPGIVPPSTAGTMLAYQAALADPLSAFGVSLTAATGVTIAQNWISTPVSLGDEGFYSINLANFQIPFYGVGYSQIYVYANGYMTFGPTPVSDFTPSNVEFNSGPPRLAGFWTDLDCNYGSVVVTIASASTGNAPGFVRVDYTNVSDYAIYTPHTFSMQIHASGIVQIIHTSNGFASNYDQITGIGPGGNMSTVPQKDLSANATPGSLLGAVNETFFEWFGLFWMPYYGNPFEDPYDLFGKTLTFFPMGTGGVPQSTQRYLLY